MCVCTPVCVEEKSLCFFFSSLLFLLAYSLARSFAFTFQVERIVFSLYVSSSFPRSPLVFLSSYSFVRSEKKSAVAIVTNTHISIDTAEREITGYTALVNEMNSCHVCLHAIITGEEVIRLIKRRKDGEKKTFSPDMKHRVGSLSLSLARIET